MSLSKKAIMEIQELSCDAELLAKGSAAERARSSVLLQRISTIKQIGLSSTEVRALYAEGLNEELNPPHKKGEYRAMFDRHLAGQVSDRELRDFLSGTQAVTWTQGISGGYTVPFDYDDQLRVSMAETDPVLDEDIVDFSMTDGPFRPGQVSGYDLSQVNASVIGEAQQFGPLVNPTALGKTLRSDITFRANFAGSYEAEMDIPDFGTKIVRATSVALARKIGRSALAGRGGTDISGIQNLLSVSVNNGTPGKIVSQDVLNIFFSIDRFYRKQKKCSWLMSDAAYKQVRSAADSQGRPLLDFVNDKEQLMGKPVYVAPSLGNGIFFSLGVGVILFGDLSHIVVRASRPSIQRQVQSGLNDITRGEALYVGRMRADATYYDPSSGAVPPVVMALIS